MPGNRVIRSQEVQPRVLSDKTVSGALLPCTAVSVGATQLTQATSASGVRLALLANRDYYAATADLFNATNPLLIAYTSGETGLAVMLQPDLEVVWAMAAGTYTFGQELTVAASGRLAAAVAGNVVVAHFDDASLSGTALAAGALADVCVANFYTKA